MEKSEQINELVKALSLAQGVIIPATKDANNPFFRSKYADLASIWEVARDPLSKNGLAIIQLPSAEGNIVTLETVLVHSSGQFISSRLTMVAKDASPQAIGSCITYLRRYALSSVVGIASEDDDGNAASTHKSSTEAIVDPKKAVSHDPNEDVITVEQGESLLTMLKGKGYTKEDLKQYISFELELDGITKIKNKHLMKIKEWFSKPKDNPNV